MSGGTILINTTRSCEDLGLKELVHRFRTCTVPATDLALKHVGRPVPNAALLGGFSALSRQISLASVTAAIGEKFSGKVAAGNIAAAREAFLHVEAN